MLPNFIIINWFICVEMFFKLKLCGKNYQFVLYSLSSLLICRSRPHSFYACFLRCNYAAFYLPYLGWVICLWKYEKKKTLRNVSEEGTCRRKVNHDVIQCNECNSRLLWLGLTIQIDSRFKIFIYARTYNLVKGRRQIELSVWD